MRMSGSIDVVRVLSFVCVRSVKLFCTLVYLCARTHDTLLLNVLAEWHTCQTEDLTPHKYLQRLIQPQRFRSRCFLEIGTALMIVDF